MLELDVLARSMLLADLAEFLDMPMSEVRSCTAGGSQSTIAEEKKWQGSREDFYRTRNDCWLFDLADLNTNTNYWATTITPLMGIRNRNILDFGCGIGTTSLFLALSRNRVYGYDINSRVLEFAEFRKEKFGFSHITFSGELPDLSQFDVIVAIDIFEHIENLHGLLLHLGQGVKRGTKLYHFDSFADIHPHPLHYDRPEDLDGWLEEAGFTVWDKRWAIKHA